MLRILGLRRGKKVPSKKGPAWTSTVAVLTAVAGLGGILAFFLSLTRRVGSIDEDAYISFRYARNLLNGDGLIFNPGGERVEGITNLLWTLAVSAGSRLGGYEIPDTALALGVACGALTVLLVYWWCYEELLSGGLSRGAAALAGLSAPLLLVLAPGFAFYSASGLEVALFALLIAGGLYAVSRADSLWLVAGGSLLLGAAAITRPEGALVLAIGSAACALHSAASWKERGFRLLAGAVPGFAGLAAVTLWRLLYYGSPVPNTAFAKAGGFEVVERWGLPYLVEAAQGTWFPVVWALVLAGAFLDRGFLLRSLAVLAVVPVWSAYVVYVGGDYMPSARLFVPLLPVLYVFAGPAVNRISGALLGSAAGRPRLARAAVLAVPVVALGTLFLLQVPERIETEEQAKVESDEETDYRRAVAGLFEEHDPDVLVAANAVGVLGYYSDVRIIDMLGLNDAHIARHGEKEPEFIPGHQSGDGEYVLSREPDYIIPWSVEPEYRFVSDRDLGNSERFREEYESVRAELEGEYELPMFRRNPADG